MSQGDIALRTGLGEELGVGRGFAECEGRLDSADLKIGRVEMYGFVEGEFEQGAAWLRRRYRYRVLGSQRWWLAKCAHMVGSIQETKLLEFTFTPHRTEM